MRKFYLINENGERFSLQDLKECAYLTDPNGLGYENGYTYVKVGNSFQRESQELKQMVFTATVVFESNEKYQEYIKYVENTDSLRMVYAPDDIEYYKDIDMESIGKTEKSGHWFHCPVKFNTKSLYYTEDSQEYTVEEAEGECRFPIRFGSRFNDYSMILFDYFNAGHSEGEILAEIDGFIQRPTIEMYVNGVLKSKMLFDITIQQGQKLLYSAKSGDNYVILEDVDGTQTNIKTCLKLENDNFFKIPRGTSSLKLTSESGTTNRTVIRVLTSYKGV